jgi:periplasmic protein TonB
MPFTARRTRRLAAVAAAIVATLVAPRLVLAQDVYGAEQISSPPKLVSPAATARAVARSFPEELRRANTGGTVQLQFVIGANGKVEPNTIEVLETPVPALAAAAKTVAEKMEFVPGKKDGAAVRTRVQLPITYKP